ncbi:MAG: hypothetical protein IJK18_09030 [Clostridia bacterium]|nr:hypothetical protein [Clostridia bacterium]
MNQILSVEMPKKKSKVKSSKGQGNKASTKSVVIFFSIVLLLFGISLIGISLYSMLGKNKTSTSNAQIGLPRIDVTQNATELEIDISCASEIASIEYQWEEKPKQEVAVRGKKSTDLTVSIPSGTNIFTIKVTDVDNNSSEFSKEYVGAKEPNITAFGQKENKIIISCQETQTIKFISYNYDEKDDQVKEINNTAGTIEIDALEGEHELTIKVGYEDGTVGRISKKIYIPTIKIGTDGANSRYTKFIINASDSRTIDKVKINFNGTIIEEQINDMTYTKEIPLQPGEPGSNKMIITVYNKDGMSITKRVWDKNRQK